MLGHTCGGWLPCRGPRLIWRQVLLRHYQEVVVYPNCPDGRHLLVQWITRYASSGLDQAIARFPCSLFSRRYQPHGHGILELPNRNRSNQLRNRRFRSLLCTSCRRPAPACLHRCFPDAPRDVCSHRLSYENTHNSVSNHGRKWRMREALGPVLWRWP
jgi:hypothetical protein